MTSLFRCPVCGAPLDRDERVCRCPGGHSYDIAREGYTYLLPPNQKHSAAPGDDRGMAAARRDFLSKGYYAPLLNTLCCQILALSGDSPVIWDVGCGEGYYTAGIYQALTDAGRSPPDGGDGHLQIHPPLCRQTGTGHRVGGGLLLPSAGGGRDRRTCCWTASPPWPWRSSAGC